MMLSFGCWILAIGSLLLLTAASASSSSFAASGNDASCGVGECRRIPTLLLMDCFSPYHGEHLEFRAEQGYGLRAIRIFSNYMKGYFMKELNDDPDQLHDLLSRCVPDDDEEFESWRRRLEEEHLVLAIHCESDSGLAEAEGLGAKLGLPFHNSVNEARRQKHLMNQEAERAGLKVVRQSLCQSLEEAREFAAKELSTNQRVVVKPIRGVASDDVFLCRDMDEVDVAFHKIHGSTVFGSPREKHDHVLLQEFAVGQEYALDIVSKDGHHKVLAIWEYDKRPANGASFVYFGTKIFNDEGEGDDDSKVSTVISEYIRKCLDALDVRWGLSHCEVILTEDGPRLVEINCRQHNMNFLPIVMFAIGYNCFDVLLASYTDALMGEEKNNDVLLWDDVPDMPTPKRLGAMMHLVNFVEGTLLGENEMALTEIQNMESVYDLEVYRSFLERGEHIVPTKDIRSDAGWVQLINDDPDAFRRDYERIVELMPTLFFVQADDEEPSLGSL